MTDAHRYRATASWRGSTAVGYDVYDRTHDVVVPPARQPLVVSADPAFRGDPDLVNPEQLVLAAASSCQLLSFLAVAARARIDVVAYEDHADAVMPEGARPMWLTAIVLRPTIDVVEGPTRAAVERLVRIAHDECFIVASLRTEVTVEPTIRFVAAPGTSPEVAASHGP